MNPKPGPGRPSRREPTYRLALLAYPRSYRREHGPELADTANQLAGGRWSARQARSLLIGGLRTRPRLAVGDAPRDLWGAGVGLVLALGHLYATAMALLLWLDPRDVTFSPPAPVRIGLGILVLAVLSCTTRWPAAVAITTVTVITAIKSWDDRLLSDGAVWYGVAGWVQTALTLAAAWWLALRTTGRRALPPVWTAGLLAALTVPGLIVGGPEATSVLYAATLLALTGIGLVLSTVDPRPVIAAGALWATWVPFHLAVLGSTLTSDDELVGWGHLTLGLSTVVTVTAFALGHRAVRRYATG